MPDLLRKNFLLTGESAELGFRPSARRAIDHSSITGWDRSASNLSHELRTPLASMKGSLSLVLSEEAGPLAAEQTHFLEMVMRNINRLDRLIDDRLGQAQGHQNEPLPTVDVMPVIAEVIEMQSIAAGEAGVQLNAFDLPQKLDVQIDPDKLVQILTNVMNNAIKYTPQGGLVRVWLDQGLPADPGLAGQLAREFHLAWQTFRLTIQDTGIGLSRTACARVFEPWFRASAEIPGSGLGLSITNSLVAEHGGHIRLDSALGHGTTVRIDLPRNHASGVLMRGANRLQDMVSDGRSQMIAALDGRDANPDQLLALVSEFLAARSDHEVVHLAPGLLATVVPTAAAWSQDWEADWRAHLHNNHCTSAPCWRLLAWHGGPNDKSSISRSTGRIQS